MDYSVFRPKKAEKKPEPAPAPAPAAKAAPAAAPTPQREENGHIPRRGGELHMGDWGGWGGGGGYMDPFMDGWGGGGGGYFDQMDHFSSARRLNNVDITYTRRALINFRDYNDSDAAYYDAQPPTRRHQVFSHDYDECCYGHGHAALPPPRSANYMLPPPPSSSRYYGGHEPYHAPPPPARYPSYFY